MNPSPLTRLLSRHVCTCNVLPSRVIQSRHLSTSPSGRAQHWTPAASTYGSTELLKRRYQPSKPEVDRSKSGDAAHKKRMRNAAYGIAACALGLAATVYFYPINSSRQPTRNDGPPSASILPDTSLKNEIEQVPTGTSSIPTFPKTIHLSELTAPSDASILDRSGEQEYQLVGVGVRSVSFLSIQVYVVGMYVAVPDIAKVQERLVRVIDPVATTLVAGEKTQLKEMLLNNEQSEDVWNKVLKDGGIRTVFRIVPIRNTDFLHLRDGWIRGITAKTQHFSQKKKDDSFSDESFGAALNEFKTVIGGSLKGKIPWGETIMLTRDGRGKLSSWYENKKGDKVNLGEVKDERISRLIWLIYLGGANVSSEGLRKSVVDGLMEFVERPVGTVATQVV